MIEFYQTITQSTSAEFKDRGSKFIGYAIPASTEDEVKEQLQRLHDEHPKGRHVCYAFRVGVQEPLERSNDDGEPSGSAGKPILGQIHSAEVTNTLVAVVRYFGGTKLGVPGLINAYKTAAADALANNEIVTQQVMAYYKIETHYEHFYQVMNYIKRQSIEICDQRMEEFCRLTVRVVINDEADFKTKMQEIEGVLTNFINYE